MNAPAARARQRARACRAANQILTHRKSNFAAGFFGDVMMKSVQVQVQKGNKANMYFLLQYSKMIRPKDHIYYSTVELTSPLLCSDT